MFFAQESGRDKETKSQREEEWERGRVGERKRRREDLSLPGRIFLLACGDTVELRGWRGCVFEREKQKGIEEPNASIPFSTIFVSAILI